MIRAVGLLLITGALGAKLAAPAGLPSSRQAQRAAAAEAQRAAMSSQTPQREVPWSMRGAWLLQETQHLCEGDVDCSAETIHVLVLLSSLCIAIVGVVCAFTFIREDKEEQITPLCPQLVVRSSDLKFQMAIDTPSGAFDVTTSTEPQETLCSVAMDWTDPLKGGTGGVAATVRLKNTMDFTVATVVARNVAVVGQSLALCRAGCEIFGFVEPDGDHRYHVRHRTGVHLLTLTGDFNSCQIDGLNPVGAKVCTVQRINGEIHGRVLQHVDAGLVMCSLLATHVHRRLAPKPAPAALPAPMPPPSTEAPEEGEDASAPVFQGAATPPAGDPFLQSAPSVQG